MNCQVHSFQAYVEMFDAFVPLTDRLLPSYRFFPEGETS